MVKSRSHFSRKKMSSGKKVCIILIVAAIILVIAAGLTAYIRDYYHATITAQEAMVGDDTVTVTDEEDYVYFHNQKSETDGGDIQRGIILYPGAKVEHTAYAPMLRMFAEAGYEVYLAKMPCRIALLGINAADEIMEAAPEVEEWILMGHSLGGWAAAQYAEAHTDQVHGLVLLAAYSQKDLSDSGLTVASIYGSNDQVLNQKNYEKYRSNLPADVTEFVIEGGNHAGYGYYGEQRGDGSADITRREQQNAVVDLICHIYGK